jgi:ribosomal protein S6
MNSSLYTLYVHTAPAKASALEKAVESVIARLGGKLHKIEKDKQRLAYPIRKATESLLLTIEFSLAPTKLDALREEVKHNATILRWRLLRGKSTANERALSDAFVQLRSRLSSRPTTAPATKQEGKVSLQQLEKKIDEILSREVI